jgi:hypothetical protein
MADCRKRKIVDSLTYSITKISNQVIFIRTKMRIMEVMVVMMMVLVICATAVAAYDDDDHVVEYIISDSAVRLL